MSAGRGHIRIECACCALHWPIRDLDLLISMYYHEPHGCTGGDYSTEDELQFLCPNSGWRNRLLFDDWHLKYEDREKPELSAKVAFENRFRAWFKSETRFWDGDAIGKMPWVNCHTVDKDRERFGLPIGRTTS